MRPARRVIARQGRRILPEQSRLVAWGAGELCSRPAGLRTIAGGFGEAEREGASVASGCGGEGAGPEVPEGGSERGVVAGGGPKGEANPLRVPISTTHSPLQATSPPASTENRNRSPSTRCARMRRFAPGSTRWRNLTRRKLRISTGGLPASDQNSASACSTNARKATPGSKGAPGKWPWNHTASGDTTTCATRTSPRRNSSVGRGWAIRLALGSPAGWQARTRPRPLPCECAGLAPR